MKCANCLGNSQLSCLVEWQWHLQVKERSNCEATWAEEDAVVALMATLEMAASEPASKDCVGWGRKAVGSCERQASWLCEKLTHSDILDMACVSAVLTVVRRVCLAPRQSVFLHPRRVLEGRPRPGDKRRGVRNRRLQISERNVRTGRHRDGVALFETSRLAYSA